MKSPLQVLTDESKWVKHRLVSRDGTRYCIEGALRKVGLWTKWKDAVAQSIREHFPERVAHWIWRRKYGDKDKELINTFNDSSETDFTQVHKVLKDVELKIENQ